MIILNRKKRNSETNKQTISNMANLKKDSSEKEQHEKTISGKETFFKEKKTEQEKRIRTALDSKV